MDQGQLTELQLLIGKLDTRLSRIERQLGVREEMKTPPPPIPKIEVKVKEKEKEKEKEEEIEQEKNPSSHSNLLGIVGVACLILAMILLIKFSIDSGWLTPVRQLILATLFGCSLIAAPLTLKQLSDKAYISMLPAGGVVILHLTNYGAIFYHQLLNPLIGIIAVWAIGFVSIWLLNKFRHDLYGILAIGGTYLGSALLKLSFPSLIPVAINVIAWDIIFTMLAIRMRNRLLICISAYFSLAVVALYQGLDSASVLNGSYAFALIQLLQIMVYSIGLSRYSIENKSPMTEKEAWQIFPVYLFFYGLEFSLFDSIYPLAATIFSIAFSLSILGFYSATRKKSGEKFSSSHPIYTLVAIMLLHSIYVVNLNDTGKMFFGLIPMALIGLYGQTLKEKKFYGLLILCYIFFGFSTFLVVANPSNLFPAAVIPLGLIYGTSVLVGYRASKEFPILVLSHGLIALSVCRLGDVIGEIWVAPLLVLCAYGALVWGLKWQDKNLGRSAFPVIFFAIGRFLFYNFEGLSQGERIITLVVMGAVIYAGGYVYRKIPELKSAESDA